MDVQRILCGGSLCGTAVATAIRRGMLSPPATFPCTDCGGSASEYDHRDYNEPLLVEPVCHRCNAKRGRAIPRRWAPGELLAAFHRSAKNFRMVPWSVDACFSRAEYAFARVEARTAGQITRHHLRPDLFDEQNERIPQTNLGPNPYARTTCRPTEQAAR